MTIEQMLLRIENTIGVLAVDDRHVVGQILAEWNDHGLAEAGLMPEDYVGFWDTLKHWLTDEKSEYQDISPREILDKMAEIES